MHLMVQNPGVCGYEALTTLGLSSTRYSSQSGLIGQFGSGSKQAVCLFLRKGYIPIIFTGKLRLEFGCREIEVKTLDGNQTYNKIFVRLTGKDEDGKQINRTEDTGMVLDFGAIDWTSVDMALREFVANAIDGSIKVVGDASAAKVEIVNSNQVRAKDGYTRFFVELTSEVSDFFLNLKKRFLHFGGNFADEQVFLQKNNNRNLLEGNKGPVFFKHGVRIGENEGSPSLFDYNINNCYVDESRNVISSSARSNIAEKIATAPTSILKRIFLSFVEEQNYYEHNLQHYNFTVDGDALKTTWQNAWKEAFGPNAVACSSSDIIVNQIRGKGLTPIIVASDDWVRAMNFYGVPTWVSVLTKHERQGIAFFEPTEIVQGVANTLWKKLESLGRTNGKEMPKIVVFTKDTEKGETLNGFSDGEGIYIHKNLSDGDNTELRLTVLEEIVHYITGASDFSRDFQNFVVELALWSLMKGEKSNES